MQQPGRLCHLLQVQASLAEIASSLKAYRPAQTALEAAIAPARRGEGAGGTGAPGLTAAHGPDGGFVEVMQQKRHQHQEAIRVGQGASTACWCCSQGCAIGHEVLP